jgi:hypothetical protein
MQNGDDERPRADTIPVPVSRYVTLISAELRLSLALDALRAVGLTEEAERILRWDIWNRSARAVSIRGSRTSQGR